MDRDKVRDRCAQIGISQNELARRCGVSPAHMSNVMAGKRSPRTDLLKRMCMVLGFRAEEIW